MQQGGLLNGTYEIPKAGIYHRLHIRRDTSVCGIDERQMGSNGPDRAKWDALPNTLLILVSVHIIHVRGRIKEGSYAIGETR